MSSAEMIRAREEAARGFWPRTQVVNVGRAERLASQVGGGIMLAGGLLRGGVGGLTLAGLGGLLLYRGATGYCALYDKIGASTADVGEGRGPAAAVPAQAGIHVEESITIDRSPEELFTFWRDYANLPRFMDSVVSVTDLGANRSHWVVRGPMGTRLEWDSEIYTEQPGELISWRSIEGGSLDTAGSVRFVRAPGGRGTEVRVNQKINPPTGKLGIAIASLLGEHPESQNREDLRRLKQLLEAGEIATTEGQPSGRASSTEGSPGDHLR